MGSGSYSRTDNKSFDTNKSDSMLKQRDAIDKISNSRQTVTQDKSPSANSIKSSFLGQLKARGSGPTPSELPALKSASNASASNTENSVIGKLNNYATYDNQKVVKDNIIKHLANDRRAESLAKSLQGHHQLPQQVGKAIENAIPGFKYHSGKALTVQLSAGAPHQAGKSTRGQKRASQHYKAHNITVDEAFKSPETIGEYIQLAKDALVNTGGFSQQEAHEAIEMEIRNQEQLNNMKIDRNLEIKENLNSCIKVKTITPSGNL